MHSLYTLMPVCLALAASPPVTQRVSQAHSDAPPLTLGMSSSTDLLDPMSQEASGTAWLPASTPMYGRMWMLRQGMLMLHGAAIPRYTDVGSTRGDRRIDAPNWFMGMYSHPLGPSNQIGIRAMFSLDPLTEGGRGYPLLFQTGETWHDNALHDRQHPHDLVDELAVAYSHRFAPQVSGLLYVAYPGEPALGPPTYMHRLIAYDLADAPIGHHWQDATHITWGVATAGLNYGSRIKLEGSVFNGREPDENRYLPDRARFDSYSGRLSYNPGADHALQVSYGFVNDPEGDGVAQHRITASWLFNRRLGANANFATALAWGQNILTTEGRSNSFLFEADWQRGRDTVFTRIENIQKSAAELVLAGLSPARKFNLGAYTVGYVRDLTRGRGIDTGVGAAITVDTKPASLDTFYGSGTPVSFQLFLRFRPSRLGGAVVATAPEAGTAQPAGSLRLDAVLSPDPPAIRAPNALVVTVTDAQGNAVDGATVQAAVTMAGMDMGKQSVRLMSLGRGRYRGEVRFSMPGRWVVTVTTARPAPAKKVISFDVPRQQ